jgi:hypothetical protein
LKQIEEKIKSRTTRLEDIIVARGKNENMVTGLLTILSVGSIIMVWLKLKSSMSGKFILGGLGGQKKTMAENYI